METLALPRIATSVASGYARRLLDPQYDRLGDAEIGQQLRALPRGEKRTLELILHTVGAVLDHTMSERGTARKFLKDVLADAPSELASRLMNGGNAYYGVTALLELNDGELEAFLDWYDGADERWRNTILQFIKRRTAVQIARILRLNPRDRNDIVQLSMRREPIVPDRLPWLDAFTARMRGEEP
ncbi:MAG TPA: hypothetical protein VD862_00875 [Candidatus Paceibacterota bacterium]|nr:hypothetical protein [Candidatus Paceibacterota bacterium]